MAEVFSDTGVSLQSGGKHLRAGPAPTFRRMLERPLLLLGPRAAGCLHYVTIYGYYMVMKQTGVAELKARLSEYLRIVRRGESVTILDRATPIAKMVPIPSTGIRIRKPAEGAPAPNRVPLLPPLKLKIDVLELLLEERQGQR